MSQSESSTDPALNALPSGHDVIAPKNLDLFGQPNERERSSFEVSQRFQTIFNKSGQPEFVVIPYQKFVQLYQQSMPEKQISRLRACREYRKLTQGELAERLKITQAALSQMEAPGKNLRRKTILKLAEALDVDPEQLL